jgi:type IV secretion system protein VirB9
VQTVSIGENFAWKITPIGSSLFIKPLQDNIHTNMTLITNQRTYYFDLYGSKPSENLEDFTYVMRFYYPDQE